MLTFEFSKYAKDFHLANSNIPLQNFLARSKRYGSTVSFGNLKLSRQINDSLFMLEGATFSCQLDHKRKLDVGCQEIFCRLSLFKKTAMLFQGLNHLPFIKCK